VAEQLQQVDRALDWMAEGLDFAHALHLAGAEACEAFVTFDKDLARVGERLSSTKMRLL
jgi:predicted nucleic acid-binding protein